ncbi:MAG: hypothetical protein LBD71_00430 [Treponema sp.]|jgi:hypothetical protein|nr:hypothetical protein [Treponema sp.]
MKGKLVFGVLFIFGFLLGSCATTDPNAPPPYQFDGTAWTKTEEYELVCKDGKVEIHCGSQLVNWLYYKGNIEGYWKVEANILTIGNNNWGNAKGHLAGGPWTLKTGTPGSNSLDGTTWARTASLELNFANGKMLAKDGGNITTVNAKGDAYRVTPTEIRIAYSDGTARGAYIVDGNTLTVTSPNTFASSRLEGNPWTKK